MITSRFARFVVLSLLVLTPRLLLAVDINALVKDTQRLVTKKQCITVVWWIPDQFWEESFKSQGNLTPEQTAAFKKIMEPYTVFCVGVLDIGMMGGIKGRDKEALTANTKFRIGNTVIPPLLPEEISSDANNFYTMMKPMFANMMGQIGQGLEFLVYKRDDLVKKSLDPLKPGSFEYQAFDETVRWRLPLGSLLPRKKDPSTAEEFPGDYEFSPYTGKKLEVVAKP